MTTMAPMTNSSPLAPAAPARSCYFVTFASAVHGGPVSEPIYATSPAEALATFNADGPTVQVLSVSSPDFAEYDPADLIDDENEESAMPATLTTIPATDIRPGDLVDTSNATPPGPIVRINRVATWGEYTYVVRYDTGYLVPDGYRWRADQNVDIYSRAS